MELDATTSELTVDVTCTPRNRANLRRLKTNSIQSFQRWEKENELLYAMIEDESAWLSKLFPDVIITPEFFFFALEDGTLLCKLANYIQEMADGFGQRTNTKIPGQLLKYKESKRGHRQSKLFHSRENVQKFLTWCRWHGIPEAILFESNDVVLVDECRTGGREIVICLMEIARRVIKYEIKEVPRLIQLEQEIDAEEANESETEESLEDEPGQALETASHLESRGDRSPIDSDSGVDSVFDEGDHPRSPRLVHLQTDESENELHKEESKLPRTPNNAKKFGKGRKTDLPSLLESTHPKTELDKKVCKIAEDYNIKLVHRLKEGKYIILGKIMFVRMLNDHMLVRIGGGWDTLEHYIMTHAPKPTTTEVQEQEEVNTPSLRSSGVWGKLFDKVKRRESQPNLVSKDFPVVLSKAERPESSPGPYKLRDRMKKKLSVTEKDEKDITDAIRKIEANLSSKSSPSFTSKTFFQLKNRFDKGIFRKDSRRASRESLTDNKKDNIIESVDKMAEPNGQDFNGFSTEHAQSEVITESQDVAEADGVVQSKVTTVTETQSITTDEGMVMQTTTVTTEVSSSDQHVTPALFKDEQFAENPDTVDDTDVQGKSEEPSLCKDYQFAENPDVSFDGAGVPKPSDLGDELCKDDRFGDNPESIGEPNPSEPEEELLKHHQFAENPNANAMFGGALQPDPYNPAEELFKDHKFADNPGVSFSDLLQPTHPEPAQSSTPEGDLPSTDIDQETPTDYDQPPTQDDAATMFDPLQPEVVAAEEPNPEEVCPEHVESPQEEAAEADQGIDGGVPEDDKQLEVDSYVVIQAEAERAESFPVQDDEVPPAVESHPGQPTVEEPTAVTEPIETSQTEAVESSPEVLLFHPDFVADEPQPEVPREVEPPVDLPVEQVEKEEAPQAETTPESLEPEGGLPEEPEPDEAPTPVVSSEVETAPEIDTQPEVPEADLSRLIHSEATVAGITTTVSEPVPVEEEAKPESEREEEVPAAAVSEEQQTPQEEPRVGSPEAEAAPKEKEELVSVEVAPPDVVEENKAEEKPKDTHKEKAASAAAKAKAPGKTTTTKAAPAKKGPPAKTTGITSKTTAARTTAGAKKPDDKKPDRPASRPPAGKTPAAKPTTAKNGATTAAAKPHAARPAPSAKRPMSAQVGKTGAEKTAAAEGSKPAAKTTTRPASAAKKAPTSAAAKPAADKTEKKPPTRPASALASKAPRPGSSAAKPKPSRAAPARNGTTKSTDRPDGKAPPSAKPKPTATATTRTTTKTSSVTKTANGVPTTKTKMTKTTTEASKNGETTTRTTVKKTTDAAGKTKTVRETKTSGPPQRGPSAKKALESKTGSKPAPSSAKAKPGPPRPKSPTKTTTTKASGTKKTTKEVKEPEKPAEAKTEEINASVEVAVESSPTEETKDLQISTSTELIPESGETVVKKEVTQTSHTETMEDGVTKTVVTQEITETVTQNGEDHVTTTTETIVQDGGGEES